MFLKPRWHVPEQNLIRCTPPPPGRGGMIATIKIPHDVNDTDSKILSEQSTSFSRGQDLKLFKFAVSSSLRRTISQTEQ